MAKATDGLAFGTHGTAGFKGYRPCRRPLSWAPPGDGLKTAKHHLNPGSNLAKNPPPQRAEVTSLKPLKEKKQAPARGQKTGRNLARTHPERQPPGNKLKTAKHHLNPGSKEKKQAPARGQKTGRNLARAHPERQPPGDGLKTAKHHLNPGSNLAKNPPPQRAEVTSLKPLKERNRPQHVDRKRNAT